MKKIMILGDSGLVGCALAKEFNKDFEVIGLSRSKKTFNYTHISFDIEKEDILPLLNKYKPNYFISCTRGDFKKQLECHKTIINYCKDNGVILYFYSTANVFDKDMTTVKYEGSEISGESDYGKYKGECEQLVQKYKEGHIIRLPMVMGVDSPRMDQIKNAHNEKITIYDPLYLSLILVDQIPLLHRQVIEKNLKGIFHFASKDYINQKEFYKVLVAKDEYLSIQKVEAMYFAVLPSRDDLIVDIYVKDILKVLEDSL